MKDLFIYNNYIMSSFVTIILQGSFKKSCYVRVLESFKGSFTYTFIQRRGGGVRQNMMTA